MKEQIPFFFYVCGEEKAGLACNSPVWIRTGTREINGGIVTRSTREKRKRNDTETKRYITRENRCAITRLNGQTSFTNVYWNLGILKLFQSVAMVESEHRLWQECSSNVSPNKSMNKHFTPSKIPTRRNERIDFPVFTDILFIKKNTQGVRDVSDRIRYPTL